jgi:putative DNA primase/helicase
MVREVFKMALKDDESKVIPLKRKKTNLPDSHRIVLLESLGLTELKIARSFMMSEEHKDNWIYNKTRKKWLYWNEAQNIWAEDTDNRMYKNIADYVELLSADYVNLDLNDKEWNQVEKAIVKLQSAQGLRNIANCCMAEAKVISETDLDADPYTVNFRNGFYSLRTNSFNPTDPFTKFFYLTKRCEVDYLYNQECPVWKKTLDDIFLGNQEYIDYIQRIFGYLLLGENKEHAVFLVYGGGRNGKGTIFDIIQTIMGSYFYQVPQNGFTTKGKDNPLIIAGLYGKRLALLSETDRGAELATSLLKSISGGDTVSGRRHHELYFQYKPTYKVFIETNHLPAIYDDPAMWERMHTIKFERYFKPEERDKKLGEKLRNELPGILQWLLEGWEKYQKNGLTKPAAAIKHTEEHRKEFDTLGHFFDECIEFTEDEEDFILPQSLYEIYSDWISRNRLKGMNGLQFGKELRKRKEITFKESKRMVINGKPTIRRCYTKMKEK